MIILSDDLGLEASGTSGRDNPIIGWHNLVTTSNISAESETDESPATNMANPATHLVWECDEDHMIGMFFIDIDVDLNDEQVNYVAIAGHNWGSLGCNVIVQADTAPSSPFLLEEIVQETEITDDLPIIIRFPTITASQVRVRIVLPPESPVPFAPLAASLYVGRILVLPRKIYQGHTPLVHARRSKVVSGKSESGKFLGRVVLNEHLQSRAQLSLIPPAFYRSDIDPFIAASKDAPFFFAWRPHSYPAEVGYAWMMNDPAPVNDPPSGLIAIDLEMMGIA